VVADYRADTMSDPYLPGHGDTSFGVRHYSLGLAYKVVGNRLDGDAQLTCVAHEDLRQVELDLAHLRVAKVWVRGKLARWTHRRNRVVVPLTAKAGEEFQVRITYAGNPRPLRARHLGTAGWEELADGVIVAAQPHGAPTWFPCNDRPGDKATYAITIAAPQDYYVAMSGELTDRTQRGSGVEWTYEMTTPMSAYLATCQIGRYAARELKGGITVVAPSDLAGPEYDASFARQPEMMRFFEDRFGDYPFDGYTCVVTDDDLEIPLESQSLSTFGRNFASEDWQSVRLVAHELAHQWFGNAVTLTEWKDIWLHEGFACYSEWLWSEEAGHQSADEWAEIHHGRLTDLKQDLLLADPGPELMFDDRVYKRGALTLHALRKTIGDEAFFDVLKSWVADNTGASVTTADFEACVASVAGSAQDALFDAWLRSTELPDLPS
jgi:aminopeptidase N